MAQAVDIENVKDLLPSDSGWDDTKIATYLDSGKTVYGVLQNFWENRASKLYTLIDISENGSSRSASRIYDNAKSQAEYWGTRVDAEKAEAEKAAEGHIAFHKITRV